METKMNRKEIVKTFLSKRPKEVDIFIKLSMDIAVLLDSAIEKLGISQKDFAALLNKNESEICKWLSGDHNFTLKTLAKIEAALDTQFIYTHKEVTEKQYFHENYEYWINNFSYYESNSEWRPFSIWMILKKNNIVIDVNDKFDKFITSSDVNQQIKENQNIIFA